MSIISFFLFVRLDGGIESRSTNIKADQLFQHKIVVNCDTTTLHKWVKAIKQINITLKIKMHRYLVDTGTWLSDVKPLNPTLREAVPDSWSAKKN